jgi:hypothetical protein
MNLKNRVVKLEVLHNSTEFLTYEQCLRITLEGGDVPKNKRFPDCSSLLKSVLHEPKNQIS